MTNQRRVEYEFSIDAGTIAKTKNGGSSKELGECLGQMSVDDVKAGNGTLAPGAGVGEVYFRRAAAALLERPQCLVHLARHSPHHVIGGALQPPQKIGHVADVQLDCSRRWLDRRGGRRLFCCCWLRWRWLEKRRGGRRFC